MVRVSSLKSADRLSKGWATRVVSIIDPDTDVPTFSVENHLVLHMNDTEVVTDTWAPRLDDVERIFTFVKPEDNTLVHCEGGISRSTAVAIGLLVSQGVSVDQAVRQVHAMSPNIAPNRLLLSLIDSHLKLGGTLERQVHEVLSSLPREMMLWCDKCQVHVPDIEGENCPGKHFC